MTTNKARSHILDDNLLIGSFSENRYVQYNADLEQADLFTRSIWVYSGDTVHGGKGWWYANHYNMATKLEFQPEMDFDLPDEEIREVMEMVYDLKLEQEGFELPYV